MFTHRKALSGLIVLGVLATLLIACAGAVPPSAAPPPPAAQPTQPPAIQPTQAPAAQPTQPPAASGGKFAGQTLTLIYFEATYAEAARAVIPDFEKQTGAKVTLVTAPYASLYEKEFTELVSGGSSYDIMQVASQWDGQFAQYMQPIDDRLKSDTAVKMDDFVQGVAQVTGTWNNVRFGIPNACDAYGIIYRTDIFDQEGIKVDAANWTWDDYVGLVKKLTKNGIMGTAIAGEKDQLDAYWTARYWSQGGHLMSQDWKTALPQRDVAVQSLQAIKDLLPYMPSGVMSYAIPDENTAFVQGKVAMAELWPSLVRGTANDPNQSKVVGKWGILPYPGHSPQLSSWSLGIPKASKNQDVAWEWIKFYTSDANQRAYLDKFGIGPTRHGIYEDQSVIAKHPDFPNMLISFSKVRPRFRIAQSQETFDYLDDRISDALTAKMTPDAAIDAVIKQWQDKITANAPSAPYVDDYLQK